MSGNYHNSARKALLLSGLAGMAFLLLCGWSPAVTHSGKDWAVHYNLPDGDTSYHTRHDPEEWAIRTALLEMIGDLKSRDESILASFTFSGSSIECGAAGPILEALDEALNRGAKVSFVVGRSVDPAQTHANGLSLKTLKLRERNPLNISRDTSPTGIMHHKVGLFEYDPLDRWTFVTSWNFTGGASSLQWNIALAVKNTALHEAFSSELKELLAGRFHGHQSKSRKHDNAGFTLQGSWGRNFVRFAPFESDRLRGDNAMRDIERFIEQAEDAIYFAVNKLTRMTIATSLIKAADRGVEVYGVMPVSDTGARGNSEPVYLALTDKSSYKTLNRVVMRQALVSAKGDRLDAGEQDLVHCKYMVVDPFGKKPVVIHGSANWTASALADDESNDENIVFIKHAGIARAFHSHFERVVGVDREVED